MRGQEADWNRYIRLHIPVRLPEVWTPLAAALSDLFAELTYDDLELSFHHAPNPEAPPRQRRAAFPEYDAVALFSGGADSFIGTAELVADGRVPALVTHAPGSAVRIASGRLRDELSNIGSLGPNLMLTAQRRGQTVAVENSQRSRSLLFLGVASVVAARADLDKVFINENGVMAVHAPMTPARVGSLSTRTASPSLLDAFGTVATQALEKSIAAVNPLQRDTKPDVVGRAAPLGLENALANTISCWAISRQNRHCGYCAPCLIRRISFETHGIRDVNYEVNPFEGDRAGNATVHDNLIQMLMLARDLAEMSPSDIELQYTELLNTGTSMTLAQSMECTRDGASRLSQWQARINIRRASRDRPPKGRAIAVRLSAYHLRQAALDPNYRLPAPGTPNPPMISTAGSLRKAVRVLHDQDAGSARASLRQSLSNYFSRPAGLQLRRRSPGRASRPTSGCPPPIRGRRSCRAVASTRQLQGTTLCLVTSTCSYSTLPVTLGGCCCSAQPRH